MPHESWYGYASGDPVQTLPLTRNEDKLKKGELTPNSYLRTGTTAMHQNRMFVQTVFGGNYDDAFKFEKKEAGSVALMIMETGYTDDGSDAATLEARAIELLRQAQAKRVEEQKRIEKLDTEVAEYRKTELTSTEGLKKNFVEWDHLDKGTKQEWRERYLAVSKLFDQKRKSVEGKWESVEFEDMMCGDRIRLKWKRTEPWSYYTVRDYDWDGNWEMEDGTTLDGGFPYYAVEAEVKE